MSLVASRAGLLAQRLASCRGFATLSQDVVTGLNYLKQGTDPPLKPDSELPEWLWELATPEKTLNELKRLNEDDLSFEELQRMVKLGNRISIKTRNDSRGK